MDRLRPIVLLLAACWLAAGESPAADLDEAASQLTGGNFKCALIIPGLASGDACITYEAVNGAFLTAQQRLSKVTPKGKSMTDIDIDNMAHVMVETTRILAKQYGLPRDAIYAGLPLIDTGKTIIDRFCPAYLKKPTCSLKRYREFNGMCNNLENPHWGATLTAFRRLLPPAFADGISDPRVSASGQELPTARYVSAYNHRDLGYHDHAVTVFLPAWGQLIDHDMTLGGESKDPATDAEPKCCDVPVNQRHPSCWPVEVPSNDPFYSLFRRRCLEFVRSAGGLGDSCRLGPRVPLNTVTSVIDANFVYGSSKETADKLRLFQGGLLKSNPELRHKGLKDLLPPKLDSPDAGCLRPHKNVYCFMAGDGRVNQQMMLVTLQTALLREHNRIATALGQINAHWDDERIYHETRHIVAAVVQHITFNEFLPMVLGKELMQRYGLILQKEGYTSYDQKLEPALPVSFFAAAFRFGHSLIPSAIERWSVTHQYVQARRLSEMLMRPFDAYRSGTCDQYMAGFMNQVSQAVDDSMTQELTNHLFQEPQSNFGSDLASLNMQRGRDNGVPGYNAWRQFCGLAKARHWDDLRGAFTNDTLRRYAEIYQSPDDIDLWSAGISERPMPGSMVGPVFGCIMGETFKNLKYGDRFWYEHSGWPSSFTLEQLNEIRKVKLSRVICDNSDHLDSAQVYVMVLTDPEINPRVKCRSSVLPRMNLEAWRDQGAQHPFHGDLTTTHDDSEGPGFFQPPGDTQNLFEPPASFDQPHPPFIPSPAPPTVTHPPVSFFQTPPQQQQPPRVPNNGPTVWSEPVPGPHPPFVPSAAPPPVQHQPRPVAPAVSQLPPAPFHPSRPPFPVHPGHWDPDPEPEPSRPAGGRKRPVKGRRPPKSKTKNPFGRQLPLHG